MYVRGLTDFAPGASRPTPVAWAVLAGGVLVAAAAAVLLVGSLKQLDSARAAARERTAKLQEQRQKQAAEALRLQRPAEIERLRVHRGVRDALRMDWTGVFDRLEEAGQHLAGRVSVTTIAPQATAGTGTRFTVSGLALTDQDMVEYVRSLREGQEPAQALLLFSRPDTLRDAAVVRFGLQLEWRGSTKGDADAAR